MTTQEIKKLHVEWRKAVAKYSDLGLKGRVREWAGRWDDQRLALNCPGFGGSVALQLTCRGLTLGLLEEPPYLWLRNTLIYFECNGRVADGDAGLQALAGAMALRYSEGIRRPLVKAALLAQDATVDNVAAALGVEPLAVDAYATLYFNVLGRKADAGYRQAAMASALAPGCRHYAVANVKPDTAALFVAGLCGKLTDVMEVAKGMGWVSAA